MKHMFYDFVNIKELWNCFKPIFRAISYCDLMLSLDFNQEQIIVLNIILLALYKKWLQNKQDNISNISNVKCL